MEEEHRVSVGVNIRARGDHVEHSNDRLREAGDPERRFPVRSKGVRRTLPPGLDVNVVGCVVPVHLPLAVDIVRAVDSE